MTAHYGDDLRGGYDAEKLPHEYDQQSLASPVMGTNHLNEPEDSNHSLHRGLTAPQMSMIAIGGAIGTGYARISLPSNCRHIH